MPATLVVGNSEPEEQAHVSVVPRPDPGHPPSLLGDPAARAAYNAELAAAQRVERDRKLDAAAPAPPPPAPRG